MTTMINSPATSSDALVNAEPLQAEQSVPPRLVRRTSSSDVFVTDLRVVAEHRFEVGVRWPGSHSFYGPATPRLHDPLLFLESVREAGLLVAHSAYEIPADNKFITREKRFSVEPEGLRTNGTEPVDVTIAVSASDIQYRGRRGFAGMLFDFECFREGVRVGTATYRFSLVTSAVYARLRGEYRNALPEMPAGTEPVRRDLVGRCADIDVMLADAPGANTWLLRVDPEHEVVYDHPIDHVPGNAVVEAGRQAALLASGLADAIPVGGDLAFHRYIEFDQPCTVTAVPLDATTVRFAFEQGGLCVAEGVLDLRTP